MGTCPHEHLQVMRLPVVSVLNISEWPARWPYFISLMSVVLRDRGEVLRDRGDGLVPSLFGMFPEIGGDASAQVCRCRDVFVLDSFDRFLDDLFQALIVDKQSVGIAKPIGFRNQLLDAVFFELGLR